MFFLHAITIDPYTVIMFFTLVFDTEAHVESRVVFVSR